MQKLPSEIANGDRVKCKVTQFEGIVTSISVFLNGCVRCAVQPTIDKDGKNRDALWFDLQQLEVIERAVVTHVETLDVADLPPVHMEPVRQRATGGDRPDASRAADAPVG